LYKSACIAATVLIFLCIEGYSGESYLGW